jgi:hypothetical protein
MSRSADMGTVGQLVEALSRLDQSARISINVTEDDAYRVIAQSPEAWFAVEVKPDGEDVMLYIGDEMEDDDER